MISRFAVDKYLDRKLESYDWLKHENLTKIDSVIESLTPVPVFHTEPRLHQKICFLIGIFNPEWLFFCDMGTGKTKIMLDIFSYKIQTLEACAALVLVPNIISIDSWIKEADKHQPNLEIVPLLGTTKRRKDLIDNIEYKIKNKKHMLKNKKFHKQARICVINYQGLVYLCTKLVKNKKGKGSSREIDLKMVEYVSEHFDTFIADESQKCKNHRSLTYKICNLITNNCKHRYALTGTPFGRDPHDLWAQFYMIDKGETLGSTLGIFRSAFFTTKKNYWGGYIYSFKKTKYKTLYAFLKNRSIRYSSEECLDLPKKVFTKIYVAFPKDTEQYYRDVLKQMISAQGNLLRMNDGFIKMRQLASGFMAGKDDSGKRVEIDLPENPKLDALMELLEGIPDNRKVIVFHEFIKTGETISAALKEKGIGHERLWSGTKDKAESMNIFVKNPGCKIFVINHQTGAQVLNLQCAQYCVFYESPVSPIVRQQAEKRCHRDGQTANRVFYYDIIMKNSVDDRILSFIKEGKDLFRALIEGKADLRMLLC